MQKGLSLEMDYLLFNKITLMVNKSLALELNELWKTFLGNEITY